MAKGFKHGTSGKKENPLNFAVVAYPSEVELNTALPEDTTITTVGVVTTNPITGWYFASEQPEDMKEGEVWFGTDKSSEVEFNALKKNNVTVYPTGAKQMVSGKLEEVTIKCYQDGEWVNFWNGELYTPGNEWTDRTGGWTSSGYVVDYEGEPCTMATGTKTANYMEVWYTSSDVEYIVGTANKIDLTGISYIEADVTYISGNKLALTASSSKNISMNVTSPFVWATTSGTVRLDVTNLTSAYISLCPYCTIVGGAPKWRITKVRLVK